MKRVILGSLMSCMLVGQVCAGEWLSSKKDVGCFVGGAVLGAAVPYLGGRLFPEHSRLPLRFDDQGVNAQRQAGLVDERERIAGQPGLNAQTQPAITAVVQGDLERIRNSYLKDTSDDGAFRRARLFAALSCAGGLVALCFSKNRLWQSIAGGCCIGSIMIGLYSNRKVCNLHRKWLTGPQPETV